MPCPPSTLTRRLLQSVAGGWDGGYGGYNFGVPAGFQPAMQSGWPGAQPRPAPQQAYGGAYGQPGMYGGGIPAYAFQQSGFHQGYSAQVRSRAARDAACAFEHRILGTRAPAPCSPRASTRFRCDQSPISNGRM